MHRTDELPDALARLVALGQSPDVNIRPVLLRVVVDLFVSKAHHAPGDIHQFNAIVSLLLDDADAEARALVAEKMARHPLTPWSLIERFLNDEAPVAAKVYAHGALDPATLLSAATWGPAPLAVAIAGRPDITPEMTTALAARPEDAVVHALVANPAAVLERPAFQQLVRRAREDGVLAARLIDRPADPIDLAPLFPLARPAQRQAIIDAARRLELGKRQWGRLDSTTHEVLARLDRMVMAGERENFEAALGLALGVDAGTMADLLRDEGGEILALALAAVGASPDMAARVFILGDPAIGHFEPRVRALMGVVASVSTHAARRLIAAMAPAPAEPPRRAASPAGRPIPAPRRVAEPALEPGVARRDPARPVRRIG